MAWTRFGKKKDMPGGLWIKCESCGAMLFRKEFEQRNRVCPNCNYHFTLPARDRVALTADAGRQGPHLVRPEALRLDDTGAAGHVATCRFVGAGYRIAVRLEAGDTVQVATAAPREVGAAVRVTAPAGAVLPDGPTPT